MIYNTHIITTLIALQQSAFLFAVCFNFKVVLLNILKLKLKKKVAFLKESSLKV